MAHPASHGYGGAPDGAAVASHGYAGGMVGAEPGLTPFDAFLGDLQRRVPAPAGDPTPGDWLLALGSLAEGRADDLGILNDAGGALGLTVGDAVEATQAVDVTAASLLRIGVRLRVPADATLGWRCVLKVDGVEHAALVGRPGVTRVAGDLAANVRAMVGVVTLAIRLEATAP